MDKKTILKNKIELLIEEIEDAKPKVGAEKCKYLDDFKLRLENIIFKLTNNEFSESEGRILGTMRCISEYDSLAEIKTLYDAATDVDLYYSKECKECHLLNIWRQKELLKMMDFA